MAHPSFTTIIPAHNEGNVIERCLLALYRDAPAEHSMQVIIAANGCTDNTAALARKAAPQAQVIELEEGSKPNAMNAGRAIATHPICVFLDADVQISYGSLAALARALEEPGVMVASPALRMDLSRSNPLVKCYYRVWLNLPYVTDRMVGSGCFGLSEQASMALGDFPAIIGDDIWVRSKFGFSERRNISRDEDGEPVFFLVSPPRTLRDQIRVEARRRAGNRQVDALLAKEISQANHRNTHGWRDIARAVGKGATWVDALVYVAAKIAVVAKTNWTGVKGKTPSWERDLAARES